EALRQPDAAEGRANARNVASCACGAGFRHEDQKLIATYPCTIGRRLEHLRQAFLWPDGERIPGLAGGQPVVEGRLGPNVLLPARRDDVAVMKQVTVRLQRVFRRGDSLGEAG